MNSGNTGSGGTQVSVCIPTYNASRYIGETIRSVLDSSYSNLEVIVNDDSSTDDTRKIVEGLGDGRVRFFQNDSNLGVPQNWNRALEKASGEFLGLLNHDDLYGPFWLTFAAHVLEKYPHIGWVATAFHIIDQKSRPLQVISRFRETGERDQAKTFIFAARLDGLGPGFLVRRKALEDVGLYDEDIGPSADNDLFLRLASRHQLYYSSYPHNSWRLHANNLTHRWGVIEQTTESLRILGKAFGDPSLSKELLKHKESSYAYFYSKVLMRSRELIANGDTRTARHLIRLLFTEGYRE